MVPRAATLDRKWNEAANAHLDDWAERADFTGRFDFFWTCNAWVRSISTICEVVVHGPVPDVDRSFVSDLLEPRPISLLILALRPPQNMAARVRFGALSCAFALPGRIC
jgi:hypothetical protein